MSLAGRFGFELKRSSAGQIQGMVWRFGRDRRDSDVPPINFERNHHNIFVCLYNFTIPPCKKGKKDISSVSESVYGGLPG
jgi:hypothetical protein